MTDARLTAAIRNNADWCDAIVNAGHNGATAFAPAYWINRELSPPFYPNLITLTPDGAAEQCAAIAAVTFEEEWGVKDSFATLDLAPLGFELLFDAVWLWRAPREDEAAASGWSRANNAVKLAAWERGFSAGEEPLHLFRRPLLDDPDIAFFATWQKETATQGFAANRHAGVTAISNAFTAEREAAFVKDVIATASAFAKGTPLVCYMPESETAPWRAEGFEPIGPLRIWLKN
jgi:hypothetical protein